MKFIQLTIANRIATITLNRPEKRNAFNPQLVSDLKEAFSNVEKDDLAKVVILRANGPVFSAGADLGYLQELQNNSFEENLSDSNHLKELYQQIYEFPKIVIAQLEGHAIAGGAGLATVCDFVYSVPEALIGYTEIKIGFVPAMVSLFLIRKVGEAAARELLLTAKLIPAQEALKLGLITAIHSKENIELAVVSLAEKLSATVSGQSIALTKKLFTDLAHLSTTKALNLSSEMNAKARATADCKRGIGAFLDKKKLSGRATHPKKYSKMKLNSLRMWVCILPLFLALTTMAQIKEGQVTYSVELKGAAAMAAAFLGDLKMDIHFNQDFVRVDMDMGMAQTSNISNLQTGENVTLMDVLGKKTLMRTSAEDVEGQQPDGSYRVERTSETIEIAGFECRRNIIHIDGGSQLEIYTTDEIQVAHQLNMQYTQLEGFPMKFEMQEEGVQMEMIAKGVEAKAIDASFFEIPEGYEEKDLEEIQKELGR